MSEETKTVEELIEEDKPTPGKLKYVMGDLFELAPLDGAGGGGFKTVCIPHICNDQGAWGAGFVVPLGDKFPDAKDSYLSWHSNGRYNKNTDGERVSFELGAAQMVHIDHQPVIVANMIGQEGTGPDDRGNPPIRYTELAKAMMSVFWYFQGDLEDDGDFHNWEIHAPKFGSGLAGGDWNIIEGLIKTAWIEEGVDVTIYSLD